MKKPIIGWTMYGPLDNETSLMDPLAFDYFAQVLGNVVLPSFTSRTDRARYYGMVAYGIYISRQFLRSQGMIERETAVLHTFELYERYWARAIVAYYTKYGGGLRERSGKETGFRGIRGAVSSFDRRITSLDYKLMTRQLELGGLGAYRTSMESLGLIREDLTLTHAGFAFAESYLGSKRYDDLMLEAIRTEKIIERKGRATINSLGGEAALDKEIGITEKHLLEEYVIKNKKNITAIKYIYNASKAFDSKANAMDIVHIIVNSGYNNEEEERTVSAYRTIYAFETLAIKLNNIWCAALGEVFDCGGRLSLSELANRISARLDLLRESNDISVLLSQTHYHVLCSKIHGPQFNCWISKHKEMVSYTDFLRDMICYHQEVIKERQSGSWLLLDGQDIYSNYGYSYAQKMSESSLLHGYKTNNILTIVKDVKWEP